MFKIVSTEFKQYLTFVYFPADKQPAEYHDQDFLIQYPNLPPQTNFYAHMGPTHGSKEKEEKSKHKPHRAILYSLKRLEFYLRPISLSQRESSKPALIIIVIFIPSILLLVVFSNDEKTSREKP